MERPGSAWSRRCGAAASPRPSDAGPTSAAAAAHGSPVTGRDQSPSAHCAAPHEQDQAVTLVSGALIGGRRSQGPARNAAHCPCRPLHPRGHPKILLTAPQKPLRRSVFGTHPCARSLCRPGGPDGECQPKARPEMRAANLSAVAGRLLFHQGLAITLTESSANSPTQAAIAA
jgi:hypothetical protein